MERGYGQTPRPDPFTAEEVYLEITDYREIMTAIKELKVRGAPAIGVAGAYGLVLGLGRYLQKVRPLSSLSCI